MKWKMTPYLKGVLHGSCPLSTCRRVCRVNMWFKCFLWIVTVLKMLLRFSGALDAIAWTVCLSRYFLFPYGLGSVLDDERLTMYEDFASTFRGEKTIQACLCEDLKVSGYFLLLLSQSNSCTYFASQNFFLTFLLFRCEKLVFVGLSRLWYQGFSLHHFIYLQKGTRT